jgi:hypothetical protein
MGPSGSGKTTSLKTLLDIPNLEVFAIFTDPRFDILGKEVLDRIHWRYLPPAVPGWDTLKRVASQVNKLSNEALQKLQSVEGSSFMQYIEFLDQCNDFVDQHGESFGDVCTWEPNRVLFIDGLTGLNKMARSLTVGAKATLTQPDWGSSQFMVTQIVDALTTTTKCHFIMTAHVERELDEINGGTRIMVSTLGRKLAPLIPINFGDVILVLREGQEFYWDTIDTRADLKPAFAEFGAKQKPSFVPLFKKWQRAGGVIAPHTQPSV